jgi:hypothetical protein
MIYRTFLCVFVIVSTGLPSALLQADEFSGMKKTSIDLKSATTLVFGPDGILFIGDSKAATVFAVATGHSDVDLHDQSIQIDDVLAKLAAYTKAEQVAIQDLVVNPRTGTPFLAVHADQKPLIVKVIGNSDFEVLDLQACPSSSAVLNDAPEDKVIQQGRRSRNPRADSITDLAFFENKLLVSGLRDAVASSTVRELNFPFSDQERGVGVQIYHAAHGREEDTAAMQTFVPLVIDGEPTIVGAYVCTPLVKIPVKDLSRAGESVGATTVAELGNRNRPLDMVSYEQDGKEYLLLSNSARGVMKIPTDGLGDAPELAEPVRGGGTAGQSYETVESLDGILEMDRQGEESLLVLSQDEKGLQHLQTVPLP